MSYGTRTDCERNNRAVPVPNVFKYSGISLGRAKRGHWITWQSEGSEHCGRVVGRVTCEGTIYVEVMALSYGANSAYVRWIDPNNVTSCQAVPPTEIFRFLCGDWTDAHAILTRASQGFVSDTMKKEIYGTPLPGFDSAE